jgi:hypothetical protein
VLEYEPANVFAGTETPTVGVTVNLPIPVLAAALKNFTAVGAVEPAGTATGYATAFVGLVHVPVAHDEVTLLIDEALVESVFGVPPPVENVVDVIVRFQPVPVPRASVTVRGRVYVGVWSVPSSVTEKLGVADVASARLPPVTVAVTLAVSAPAVPAPIATATVVRARAISLFWMLSVFMILVSAAMQLTYRVLVGRMRHSLE